MRATPEKHLNLNVRGRPLSSTVAINERSDELRRAGLRIFKLGLGQSPFPVPAEMVERLKANAHQKDYLPVRGLPALREAVAAYHRRHEGIPATAEDVLVGPGSKELMFLLQLVYYGDLIVPSPAWVSYAPQARIIGRRDIFLRTRNEDGWLLTPDQLEGLCAEDPDRPRLAILNYPSNPTGNTYVLNDLRALAKVAHRHKIVVLSDEIYGELHFKGQHVSIARFYPEGTIISTGLSKWCGAGGWRLGTCLFPKGLRWLLDAMSSVASETYTSTCAPIQHAAVAAYEGGPWMERYLQGERRILASLGGWCAERLSSTGIDCWKPVGAFYLFPDFTPLRSSLRARGIRSSRQLCDSLLKDTGVAILPGVDFGRPEEELTARIAYVDFDGALALASLAADSARRPLGVTWLRQYCGNVTEAIDRVVDWTRKRS